MLKRDPSGKFGYREVGFFKKKRLWRFYTGRIWTLREWEEEDYLALLEHQKHTPQAVLRDDSRGKTWWMFGNEFYWEDENFSTVAVEALILDRIQQKERKVQRAVARIQENGPELSAARRSIPDHVKTFVWQRDGGRCVKCGSQRNLEYDHIIPVSKGGSNTARNIQLFCERCNRSKGANIA